MHCALFDHTSLTKRLYREMLRPVMQRYGLTRMELDILLFLANNPPYDTARDLVRLRLLSKSQVSVSLETLERRGYLSSWHTADNRKVAHLRLLPPSDAAVADGRDAQAAFIGVLTRGVPQQELAAFERTAARFAENIRAYFTEEQAK